MHDERGTESRPKQGGLGRRRYACMESEVFGDLRGVNWSSAGVEIHVTKSTVGRRCI